MKRIVVITGSRAEYDRLYSPLKAIEQHPELELRLLVTGAHFSALFGETVRQIEADGFVIEERIETLLDSNSLAGRARGTGFQLASLAQSFARLEPDAVLVFGDREETISAAVACTYMNIPLAHICGGDIVVGNADDTVRHAVTKLAHMHFPASEASAANIAHMGEERWRIHTVGDPGLDRIRLEPEIPLAELGERLGMDFSVGPVALLVQHPVSSEVHDAADQLRITLETLRDMELKTLVGYPNSDAGSREMIEVVDSFCSTHEQFRSYANLDRSVFVNMLRNVDVLVGNSSMGIYEAPMLRLATVNVGTRQTSREHAENMLFVSHDHASIRGGIETALYDKDFRARLAECGHRFGDGHSGPRIASRLAEMLSDDRLLVKKWEE